MIIILFRILGICHPRFKCTSLSNQNFFQIFSFHFWNLHQILNILKKQMIAISPFFRKLQNVKNMVRPLSKKHRSRTPFDSQHDKGSPTQAKSASDRFYQIFSSLRETLIWKISPLLNS